MEQEQYVKALEHARGLLESLEAWQMVPEEHKEKTPERMLKALIQVTTPEPFNFTVFPNDENIDEMVTVGPIPFNSLCAHHVVPFIGNAWVSYVPDANIAGLSKLARTVKWASKGLWVQENLTKFIADSLEDALKPLGVGVVLKAEHLCMATRGVAVLGAVTTTAVMRGVYSDHSRTAKAEFLGLIK